MGSPVGIVSFGDERVITDWSLVGCYMSQFSLDTSQQQSGIRGNCKQSDTHTHLHSHYKLHKNISGGVCVHVHIMEMTKMTFVYMFLKMKIKIMKVNNLFVTV